jgi:hypothetical protein
MFNPADLAGSIRDRIQHHWVVVAIILLVYTLPMTGYHAWEWWSGARRSRGAEPADSEEVLKLIGSLNET